MRAHAPDSRLSPFFNYELLDTTVTPASTLREHTPCLATSLESRAACIWKRKTQTEQFPQVRLPSAGDAPRLRSLARDINNITAAHLLEALVLLPGGERSTSHHHLHALVQSRPWPSRLLHLRTTPFFA